ncbi:Pre-mRNA-splicing factor ATP-dependent RNA helicase DEAH10, partial [Dionaea muscipula]
VLKCLLLKLRKYEALMLVGVCCIHTHYIVILATNIAKTSVTILGIKYAIDLGVVKARTYSAQTGIESLIIVPTSKAQAHQRRSMW